MRLKRSLEHILLYNAASCNGLVLFNGVRNTQATVVVASYVASECGITHAASSMWYPDAWYAV